jgi:alkaline phosphatase
MDVMIGGGHPAWNDRYVNSAIRDKLAGESGQPGAFHFVERIAGRADGGERLLAAADLVTTTRLAGLFGGDGGNLEYRLADGSGASPENPTLAEMTTAALQTLARSPQGFMLLVEGGAIDWASHRNDMDRMVGEMIDFNQAVTAVIEWVNDPNNGATWHNTLVIVTGDHETGYLTAAPGAFPDQPLGPVNEATLAAEQVIDGGQRRASWDDADGDGVIDDGETVYWAWNSGGHTNSLVPLYARGPGAAAFAAYATGRDPVRGAYLDNTAVAQVIDAVLHYGAYLPLISQ